MGNANVPAQGPLATGMRRRTFLHGAGAAALGCLPVFRIGPGSRRALSEPPPGFPEAIPVYQQAYRNWSGGIYVPDVWTAAPRHPEEVATLANWAHAYGWRLRAKGQSHGWSPLLLPPEAPGHTVLLDTTRHLTAVALDPAGTPATVTAQAGITLDVLLGVLGAAGLGLTTSPAPGCLTLGGVLAVDGHGAALPAAGEGAISGRGYGSWNNAVLALTAVVWDGARNRYALRRFRRDEAAIAPLLTHLGRAFITEATLQVGPELPLRCRSRIDIAAADLFAAPAGAGANAFQAWLEAAGRVEAIWFPFTDYPWLKVWTLAPERPADARALTGPYPYTFANWITPAQAAFAQQIVQGNPAATPDFQKLELAAAAAGLLFTDSADLWGPARYSTLYVQPSTLRLAESGYAVLTRRDQVQQVVSEYCAAFTALLEGYRARGEYPMNGPVEIRVTGLNHRGEVALAGAQEPSLSALRPRPDRPEWDCAVWLDALTLPGTPAADRFSAELEAWLLAHFAGQVRVEWSKGWGYSEAGAWTDPELLRTGIPASLSLGQAAGAAWADAVRGLDALDPQRIFSNRFLDRLLVS